MKRNYLLSIIVIGLIVISLYSTYAMFTSSVETNDVISMDTVMNYTFKINGTQELVISSKSKLRFNATIQNDMLDKISYGLYYKVISPTTLPSGVTIAEITDTSSIAKGQLNQNSEITVPIIIENDSDSEIKVEIGVVTGYATETQGIAQLIYDNGKIPITDIVNPSNITGNSCSSTLECNEECEVKEENGNYVEYCNCTNGNKVEAYTVSLNITNGTSDYLSKLVKKGSSTTFKVTPNSGYEYESLSCTGGSYNQNTKVLTVSGVTSNRTCTIKFKQSILYGYQYITNLYNNTIQSTFVNNNITYTRAISANLMTDIGGNIRYYGSNPNNYVLFNNELWRIIGIFKDVDDGTGKTETRIKIIRSESIGDFGWDYYQSGWGTATLNTYLNGSYFNYNLNSEAQSMISSAKWNLGGWNTASIFANQFYEYERGTTIYPGRGTEWVGKLALMYISDYMYAGDLSKCSEVGSYWSANQTNCGNTSWLLNTSSWQWTLTPPSNQPNYAFFVSLNGNIDSASLAMSFAARPVLFLNSKVQIIGGNGASSNPFLLLLN